VHGKAGCCLVVSNVNIAWTAREALPHLADTSWPASAVRHRAPKPHPALGPLCPGSRAAVLGGRAETMVLRPATPTARRASAVLVCAPSSCMSHTSSCKSLCILLDGILQGSEGLWQGAQLFIRFGIRSRRCGPRGAGAAGGNAGGEVHRDTTTVIP
jgi:hypothetical protein